jgi:hypothetical protein
MQIYDFFYKTTKKLGRKTQLFVPLHFFDFTRYLLVVLKKPWRASQRAKAVGKDYERKRMR